MGRYPRVSKVVERGASSMAKRRATKARCGVSYWWREGHVEAVRSDSEP
jgi:hypothetical protein